MADLGWYPDPSGRHERRFFDGVRWTEHVANHGVPGLDPLTPAMPAETSGPPLLEAASAHPPARRPWYRKKRWWAVGAAVILIAAAAAAGGSDDDEGEASTVTEIATSTSTGDDTGGEAPTTEVRATAPSTTSAPPTTSAPTTTELRRIQSGTYIVGDEIAPGLYRVERYWARLDSALEIIDNDLVSGSGLSLLHVRDTDAYIEISGEAMRLEDTPVVDPIALGFDSGTYLVGTDIAPGRYRVTPTQGSAYYARLDADGEIIDNNLSEGAVIALVSASDWAFTFSGKLEPA
jgi:hypothetical protein